MASRYTAKANGRSRNGHVLYDVSSPDDIAYINVVAREAADLAASLSAAYAFGIADERARARRAVARRKRAAGGKRRG